MFWAETAEAVNTLASPNIQRSHFFMWMVYGFVVVNYGFIVVNIVPSRAWKMYLPDAAPIATIKHPGRCACRPGCGEDEVVSVLRILKCNELSSWLHRRLLVFKKCVNNQRYSHGKQRNQKDFIAGRCFFVPVFKNKKSRQGYQ